MPPPKLSSFFFCEYCGKQFPSNFRVRASFAKSIHVWRLVPVWLEFLLGHLALWMEIRHQAACRVYCEFSFLCVCGTLCFPLLDYLYISNSTSCYTCIIFCRLIVWYSHKSVVCFSKLYVGHEIIICMWFNMIPRGNQLRFATPHRRRLAPRGHLPTGAWDQGAHFGRWVRLELQLNDMDLGEIPMGEEVGFWSLDTI